MNNSNNKYYKNKYEKYKFKYLSLKSARNSTNGGAGTVTELHDQLKCPITDKIMLDPVIASDNYTYEREAIQRIIDSANPISPKTGEKLTKELKSNIILKKMSERLGAPKAEDIIYDIKKRTIIKKWITSRGNPKLLEDLQCPITGKIMLDPVIASDNITYERENIQKIINSENPISPKTEEKLEKTLNPNKELQQVIEDIINILAEEAKAKAKKEYEEIHGPIESRNNKNYKDMYKGFNNNFVNRYDPNRPLEPESKRNIYSW